MRQGERGRPSILAFGFVGGLFSIVDRATWGMMALLSGVEGWLSKRRFQVRLSAENGLFRRRPLLSLVLLSIWLTSASAEADLGVKDYEIIGEALHATETDEWPRAFRLMETIDDPLANKLFHWIALTEDKGGANFDVLSAFIIDNSTWPRIDELQELAEAKLTDSADKDLTLALFSEHEPVSTRGRVRFAESLFAIDERDQAMQQVARVWVHGDFSAKEEKAFLERHGRYLRASDHTARLEQLLWDRQWRSARRMLDRVSKDYAKLAKARLVLQTQSPGVDRAVQSVPEELANDPGLLFDRARWRRLKGKHTGAKELLMEPLDRLVRPERWWFERRYQIRRSIQDRNFEEAYKLASRHGQISGGDYAEAEWLAGWLALRFVKRPKSAYRHFVRLYDRVKPPVRQARAAYWAGRAAAALDDDAGAVAWYRRAATHSSSYYGQLAITELQDGFAIAELEAPSEMERTVFESTELAAVARMLIAVGDQRYLDYFLKTLAEDAETPQEIGMIAEYASAAGRPTLLARLGRSAAFDGKVHEQAAFPIPDIDGLLTPIADVEPALLLGIARQESMFLSDAKSPAGARGLMQLIPSTARIVAKRVSAPYDPDRLTADHDYNALLGGHYLQTLIERFDGAVPLALAGYNAGPHRVSRWLKTHGDPRDGDRHDMVDWVELIPFDETRNYVQRVLEGYDVYGRRLAEQDVDLIDYPGLNLLHPPPIPEARPSDLSKSVKITRSDEADVAAVHRPQLKPLDQVAGELPAGADSASVKPGFDETLIQDVAVEEGDAALGAVPN